MSILVDFSATAISALTADKNVQSGRISVDANLGRHLILTQLLKIRRRFYREFGELVICVDAGNYWRKEVFPFYKGKRKIAQDASGIDWAAIFTCMSLVRTELAEFMPYKVVRVPQCEADDIIAVLTQSTDNPMLIVSGDKDFPQLQTRLGITQFIPKSETFLTTADHREFLREHIIHGDSGDGVPNILSDDDTFMVKEKRQRKLTGKLLESWRGLDYTQFKHKDLSSETIQRNWQRNEALIDLTKVPQNFKTEILATYSETTAQSRQLIRKYFMDKKLRVLTESVGEF